MPVEFIIYGKNNCCLCDEMLSQLDELIKDENIVRRLVKIDDDPELLHLYGARVPVLVSQGLELCEGKLDHSLIETHINTFRA